MKNRTVIYLISLQFRSDKSFKLQSLNSKNSRYLNIYGRWSGFFFRRKTPLIYWENKEAAQSAVSEILSAREFASKSIFVIEFEIECQEILTGFVVYSGLLKPCLRGYVTYDLSERPRRT